MRPREWVRIHDMLDAIRVVQSIFEPYGATPVLTEIEVLALQRAIEIVSEASRHVSEATKARRASTLWRLIADVGNAPRDVYRDVDQKIVKEVAQSDLPARKIVLRAILIEIDEADCSSR